MPVVAILGASGQIGRSITGPLSQHYDLILFSRDPAALHRVVTDKGVPAAVDTLEHFGSERYDIVINAIGCGDPAELDRCGRDIISVTEQFDQLVLDYLARFPHTGYIYLSSGAVYGSHYTIPVSPGTALSTAVTNDCDSRQFYVTAKRDAELRHRSWGRYAIADIRIFGYVSAQLDPSSGFFLSAVLRSLAKQSIFITPASDFVRDYVGPTELAQAIHALINSGIPNGTFDLTSAAPVTKAQLLSRLERDFGLASAHHDDEDTMTPISPVPALYSHCTRLRSVGYLPTATSIDIVVRELSMALAP